MTKHRRPFFLRFRWRVFLILGAMALVLASMLYTTHLSRQLRQTEQQHVLIWTEAYKRLMEAGAAGCDVTLHSIILSSNKYVPVILTDPDYKVEQVMNYGEDSTSIDSFLRANKAFLAAEVEELRRSEQFIHVQTEVTNNYIFYRPSRMIRALEWFPYIQFSLLALFMLLAGLTLLSGMQAEQERIWVGMAKETAHQLGTPISSLIGWIQNLRDIYPQDEYLMMVADELGKDVRLLQVVAERFSKIGTTPELKPINIYERLEAMLSYVRQRAPRRVRFDFPDFSKVAPLLVPVNALLFDWVIENLLKNALDAMETGEGEITVTVAEDKNWVVIDLKDTGKGMPKNMFKKIFQPGFTTKKRGWGLGLSLCKRIVEQYHRGKIFVKSSTQGQGTTFRIQFPLASKTTKASPDKG